MGETNQAPRETPYATVDARPENAPMKGQWQTGLCSCCNDCVPNCLMVWCCPCVSIAQISSRLGLIGYWKALVLAGVLVLAGLILWFFLLPGIIMSIVMNGNVPFIHDGRSSSYSSWTRMLWSNETDSEESGSADNTKVDFASDDNYYDDDYYYDYGYDNERYGNPTAYRTAIYVQEIITPIITLIFWISIWCLRYKTRQRFDIPGSCLGDCCATCWCSLCAMTQIATHVKSYTPGSCNFGPPDTLPAYA